MGPHLRELLGLEKSKSEKLSDNSLFLQSISSTSTAQSANRDKGF